MYYDYLNRNKHKHSDKLTTKNEGRVCPLSPNYIMLIKPQKAALLVEIIRYFFKDFKAYFHHLVICYQKLSAYSNFAKFTILNNLHVADIGPNRGYLKVCLT